jgi:N-sulfoglucosamine sulfohydrolase
MQNLIIITLDDVSFWNLGFAGAMQNFTPNINQLAKESYVFSHAHCNIPFCQPSRMVLLTGLYPQNNGSTEFCPLKPFVPTLSAILKKKGYYTSIVGKVEHHRPIESFDWDCFRRLPLGHTEQDQAKDVLEFIERGKRRKYFDSPFFSLINLTVTHRPFKSSDKIYEGPLPNFLPDVLPIRKDVFDFCESLREADSIIGEILEHVSQDDWLVLTSDHGCSFPYVKGNCYGVSTNVPLIIRNKDVLRRHDTENLVSHVDFMPTLAEAFGFSGNFDGNSYLSLLKDGGSWDNKYVYSQLNRMFHGPNCRIRAVTDKSYSYCVNFDGHYPGHAVDGWGWEKCLNEFSGGYFFERPVEEFHRNESFNLLPVDLPEQRVVFRKKLLGLMKKFRDPMLAGFTNLKSRGRILVEMSFPPLL